MVFWIERTWWREFTNHQGMEKGYSRSSSLSSQVEMPKNVWQSPLTTPAKAVTSNEHIITKKDSLTRIWRAYSIRRRALRVMVDSRYIAFQHAAERPMHSCSNRAICGHNQNFSPRNIRRTFFVSKSADRDPDTLRSSRSILPELLERVAIAPMNFSRLKRADLWRSADFTKRNTLKQLKQLSQKIRTWSSSLLIDPVDVVCFRQLSFSMSRKFGEQIYTSKLGVFRQNAVTPIRVVPPSVDRA